MPTKIDPATVEGFISFMAMTNPEDLINLLNADNIYTESQREAMAPFSEAIVHDKTVMEFLANTTLKSIVHGLPTVAGTLVTGIIIGVMLKIQEDNKNAKTRP